MSQYPQPPYGQYPPPYGGYPYYPPGAYGMDPHASLKDPAKKATVLMVLLGVLGLGAAGVCMAVPSMMNWGLNHPEIPAAQKQELRQMMSKLDQAGVTLAQVAQLYTVLVSVPSVLLLALAPFVGRRNVTGTWVAIIVVGLIALAALLALFVALAGGAQGLPLACMVLVVGALSVLLLVWLVGAVRNARIIANPAAMTPGMGAYPGAYAPYGGYPGYGQPLPPPPSGQGPVGQSPSPDPPRQQFPPPPSPPEA